VNQSASLMVRRAAEGELDLVRDLLRLAYRPYADDMPGELYHHYVANLLPADRDRQRTMVAGTADQIVGTARLYLPGEPAAARPAGAALIRAIAVRPDSEGTGVARRLMDAGADEARTFGATTVMLHTTRFMARAIRLHEVLGYRRTPAWDIDADPHFRTPTPSGVTALAYQLDLADPVRSAGAAAPTSNRDLSTRSAS
jgi:GNAT superfamily N-acetyltransferase